MFLFLIRIPDFLHGYLGSQFPQSTSETFCGGFIANCLEVYL